MSNYAISLKRTGLLLAALTFTALLMVVNLASFFGSAAAASLENRSLTLTSSLSGTSSVGAANSETNGADATHTVRFDLGTTGNLGSMILEWCTNATGTCNAPNGLVVNSGTAITTQTVEDGTASPVAFTNPFTIDAGASSVNSLVLEAALVNSTNIVAGRQVVLAFDDITNPEDPGTFFVRVQTFATTDETGGVIDDGGTAAAITSGIFITTRVAETLGFSTTGDFAGVGDPGDNCAPVTGSGAITLGDPLEQTLALDTAYDNYSAFRLYTNASNGVNVYYDGDTLSRSGGATIDQIGATPAVSTEGTEQFGLAVDQSVGTDTDVDSMSRENMNMQYVQASGDWANDGAMTIEPDYANGAGIIDTDGAEDALFAFETHASSTPARIAYTAGYTECKTAAIRYLANISPVTPSGTYTTAIVYSAVPTY